MFAGASEWAIPRRSQVNGMNWWISMAMMTFGTGMGAISGARRRPGKMAQPNWSVPQEAIIQPVVGAAMIAVSSWTSSDSGPCWNL